MRLNRDIRKHRVRSKGKLVSSRPRLSVHRSLRFMTAQIIDDTKGETMAAVSEKQFVADKPKDRIAKMAADLVTKAKKVKIETVWFDRGERTYHGKLAEFAEQLRKEGLKF